MTTTPGFDQLPAGITAYGPNDEWPDFVIEAAPKWTKGVMVWEPPFGGVMQAVPDAMLASVIATAGKALGVDEHTTIERTTLPNKTHLLFFVKPDLHAVN